MYMKMYVIRENGYRIIIILLYIQRLNGGFVDRPYTFAAHHTVYNIPTHRYLYILENCVKTAITKTLMSGHGEKRNTQVAMRVSVCII